MARGHDLYALLTQHESLLIVCHDNPDPDSLMSALALKRIAAEAGIETICLAYTGTISHQQNQTLVSLLNIPLTQMEQELTDEYELLAFVDHSIPGINNHVSPDTAVDIVIDHHPAESIDATFIDHREELGAAATIMIEYLHNLEIVPDVELATGLLFAIRCETLDFTRGATVNEYAAAEYLHPHVYIPLLKQLLNIQYSPATMDALGEAIMNRQTQHSRLVSHVETTTEPDAIPQAADFLLNIEGISLAIVFGIIHDELQLSARSADPDIHAGELLRETFGGIKSVGGHKEMGGGRIPLDDLTEGDERRQAIELAAQLVTSRLLQ